MALSFLYPLFLIGAVAVAIPITLHLLRRRTQTVVEFPAVRLLEKAPVEQHRRRRLRELILLALRVGALALLAFAFARPYFDNSSALVAAPTMVVALDTSLSLSAPGQFDAARRAAKEAVASAPATELVGLVTFADSATIVVPATTDRGAVAAAIDVAAAGAGGTRFRTALARASEAVGSAAGRIVIVTDLQQAGWEAADEGAVPDGIAVEVVEVKPPASNVALAAARRERNAIVAAIQNFGDRPVRVPVRLRAGDRDLTAQTAEVAPNASADVRLPAALPPRGAAEVRIEDPVGYQADNVRYLLLDPPAAVPILVVTAEPPGSSNSGLYVERALSVAAEGNGFAVRVIDGRELSAMSPQQFGEAAAIVLVGTSSLDRKGREMVASFLSGGGRVLLTLGPDVDLATLSDTVGSAVDVGPDSSGAAPQAVALIAVDGRHPIFRPFSSPTGALGDVLVSQYRRLNDQAGRVVLARFSGGASALTEQSVGRGRLLIFTSDLDNRWNRFPLNPAFVPWAIETARYLSAGKAHQQSFTLPDTPVGVPASPGIYDVAGRPGVAVAVNVDIRESNPVRTSVEEFTSAIERLNRPAASDLRAKAADQEDRQRLWQLTLLVMFLALAVESVVGRNAGMG